MLFVLFIVGTLVLGIGVFVYSKCKTKLYHEDKQYNAAKTNNSNIWWLRSPYADYTDLWNINQGRVKGIGCQPVSSKDLMNERADEIEANKE